MPTATGRIEVHSAKIAAHGDADCPPAIRSGWRRPRSTAAAPLYLIANQPATRLHSQLDFGGHSTDAKHRGREVAAANPEDAAARGIVDGDIIRLFNARGACLAGVRVTDAIAPGIVQLPTGAWYDPVEIRTMPLCVHGNPNVLTRDVGTSSSPRAAPDSCPRSRWKNSPPTCRRSRPSIRPAPSGMTARSASTILAFELAARPAHTPGHLGSGLIQGRRKGSAGRAGCRLGRTRQGGGEDPRPPARSRGAGGGGGAHRRRSAA